MYVYSGVCTVHDFIGMDYHIQQVAIHCRVCGQRLTKTKEKPKISYQCKAFSAEPLEATSLVMIATYSLHERLCICCKHSMQRTVITKGLHKCAVIPFQWQKHVQLNARYNKLMYKTY